MEIKINKNEKKDVEAFLDLKKSRQICIQQGSKRKVFTDFKINHLAEKLYMDSFQVKVKDIIEENHQVKTFVLEIVESKDVTFIYEAGQYITLELNIEKGVYIRPFTISGSISRFKNNTFSITVWMEENSVVSNYLFHQVNIGDIMLARGPFGHFTYHEIRDCEHILFMVDSYGISSALSMAEGIFDGNIPASITILYQAEKESDFVFKERLDNLMKNNSSIEVVYIVSEEKEGFVFGKINKEIIQKYQKSFNSYFVSGSLSLYQEMNEILPELNIPNQYIRHEIYRDYKIPSSNEEFKMTVFSQDKEFHFSCYANQSLLEVLEREGVVIPNRCQVGVCGICQSILLSGEVLTKESVISSESNSFAHIHPCSTYPLSDITIKLPY